MDSTQTRVQFSTWPLSVRLDTSASAGRVWPVWSPKSYLLDRGKPHRLLGSYGLNMSSSEAELGKSHGGSTRKLVTLPCYGTSTACPVSHRTGLMPICIIEQAFSVFMAPLGPGVEHRLSEILLKKDEGAGT